MIGVGGGIFWMGGGEWTFFMCRWEWVEVYFGRAGVGGGLWGCMGLVTPFSIERKQK